MNILAKHTMHNDIRALLALACSAHLDAVQLEHLGGLYERVGPGPLQRAASENKIEWVVADSVGRHLGEDVLPGRWRTGLAANEARVERMTSALIEVGTYFDRGGVKWALVENAGVLFASQLPVRAFCAGDFDLLVDPEHWSDTVTILSTLGFVPDSSFRHERGRAEFVKWDNGERLRLNVGHVSFDRQWTPLRYDERASAWLAERQRSNRNPDVWVLAPEQLLAFISIHTSLHYYVRAPFIRLHIDVDRIVSDNAIDWSRFVHEVQAVGTPSRALGSLLMASHWLNTPIPDEVLEALRPHSLRLMLLEHLRDNYEPFFDGPRRLGPVRTLVLDMGLSEQSVHRWFRSVLSPPREWLFQRYGRCPSDELWKLHALRILSAVQLWQPGKRSPMGR